MTRLDRRSFLKTSTALSGAARAPSLAGLVSCMPSAAPVAAPTPTPTSTGTRRGREGGYGPLRPAGPELALPEGFSYLKFGVEGTMMSDGNRTPGGHDGMAAFAMPNGNIRLIRTHELQGDPKLPTTVAPGDRSKAYDPQGVGGTTSLEIRVRPDGTPELVRDFISLTGTLINCAGGPTPWGSWLTCEETTWGTQNGWARNHGYVFEVPASAEDEVEAIPYPAMGRFVHEAVAVDPLTGTVYLTEDMQTSGFYRFIPNERGRMAAGGRLQMLAVADTPNYDTRKGQHPGIARAVRWVDIPDPDPWGGAPDAVYKQGIAGGAATFARLEGAWWGDESVYFHATSGGDAGFGQVWRYRPGEGDEGDFLLVFESPAKDVLHSPDNICCSPRGGIVICEDSAAPHIRGLTPRGEIFPFAKNIFNTREFAGATFSPDGRILFVNIQGTGRVNVEGGLISMSFAIWGPWEDGSL